MKSSKTKMYMEEFPRDEKPTIEEIASG